MNVLIVCSGNAKGFDFKINQAFIYDQVEALKKLDKSIKFYYYFIIGKGYLGYIKNLKFLKQKIRKNKIDFIHAHGGDSVTLSVLQFMIPVIGTFHGSDINNFRNRIFSNFSNFFCFKSIVVSRYLFDKIWFNYKTSVIPCGVDFDVFYPIDKKIARNKMKINKKDIIILFSSSFDRKIKNYKLAKNAIDLLKSKEKYQIKIIELKGYNRQEINLLLNSSDIALMTSYKEGSPQFIKEAMACNVPIISTDVGDVKDNIKFTEGCFIVGYDPKIIADKIELLIKNNNKTKGRINIKKFDNKKIAKKIVNIYNSII